MNPNDNDDERLIRIERMLEQLQKDSATIKHVAAKVIEVVVEVAPSLTLTPQLQPQIRKN